MYILIFILVMITPLTLLLLGLFWQKHPPKRQDAKLAYRTTLSSKNDETWTFAHRHLSRLWIRIGLILSALSCFLMVVWREIYMDIFLWVIGGQMVLLCISAFLIENLLKMTFDSKN